MGILLDGGNQILGIPEDKRRKALNLIKEIITKRKIIVRDIQKLTGTLNFLNKAIVPGRAFTIRMYSKLTNLSTRNNKILKPFHHVTLDAEFLNDCRMWEMFLNMKEKVLCRPFLDILGAQSAETLNFYTDASGSNSKGGFGCFFDGRWSFHKLENNFIKNSQPSIEYLELYALCIGVFTWSYLLKNSRIEIYCDNTSVRDIVNDSAAKSKNSMILVRMLMLECLINYIKLYVTHVRTEKNVLADSLSRLNLPRFWKNAPENTCPYPEKIPDKLWPLSKLWVHNKNSDACYPGK